MPPERPLHIALVLTHARNLACSYCYMGDHGPRPMARDVAGRAIWSNANVPRSRFATTMVERMMDCEDA
jgi:MoaA/NifB/PqqE/SkfB family radical SAM enzyme